MLEAPRSVRSLRDPSAPLEGATVVVAVGGGMQPTRQPSWSPARQSRGARRGRDDGVGAEVHRPDDVPGADAAPGVHRSVVAHRGSGDRAHPARRSRRLVIAGRRPRTCSRALAQGRADDAVSAVILATARARAARAVDERQHVEPPLTRSNIQRSVDVAGYSRRPATGSSRAGWTGPGRLAEPVDIVEAAAHVLSPQDSRGHEDRRHAGPTYEAIDSRAVRRQFAARAKMGAAIAAAAAAPRARRHADPRPSALAPPVGVSTMSVENASQLQWALAMRRKSDVIVMTAAVADYRPSHPRRRRSSAAELGPKATV